jgi:hypothetical protein
LLLPKLIQLRLKLNRMLEDSLQFCRPLVSALLVGINSRFQDQLGMDLSDAVIKEAVLAAVSHPQFKLKCVLPERRVEVTQCFVDAVVREKSAWRERNQLLIGSTGEAEIWWMGVGSYVHRIISGFFLVRI